MRDNQKDMSINELLDNQKLLGAQNKKNVFWNMIGISSNSLYAVLLMILVTRMNGLDVQGEVMFVFYLVSIFFTIGVYGGRIYQISDVEQEFSNSNYVSLKYVSNLLMFLVALIFCVASGYSFQRTGLIFIFLGYRALESIGDAYLGVMERNYRLDLTGKSMMLKTLVGLALFIIINYWTRNVYIAGLAFILSFGATLIFFDMKVANRFDKIIVKFGNHTIRLLKKCFPVFIFTFFTLAIMNVARVFVDIYLSPELLGVFNIIIMPAAVMPLFTQLIFQPFVMEFTFALNKRNFDKFNKRIRKLFLLFTLIGLLAIFGAFLIGIPVLSLVYGVDLTAYRWSLVLMVFAGAVGGGNLVFSVLMTLMRQLNLQIYLFLTTFAIGVLLSIWLIGKHGINGAFVVYALLQVIQITLFSTACYLTYKKYKMLPQGECV